MNIIFIMDDSFRRDHLGCYGNSWIRTPNLDRFAQRAAMFDQFYAASYPTVPNRWDLYTGRFGLTFRGWQPLDPEDITWGDILSEHDMHTQIIWDTPMLAGGNYNYTRGFDGFTFVRGQKGDPWITDPSLPIRMPAQPYKIQDPVVLASYLRNHFNQRYEREFCVGRTISEAIGWLETNYKHNSFFLYIDMWEPHEPFDCPWYDYQLYADPNYDGGRMIYPPYGRPTSMTEEETGNARALYAGDCTLVDRWMGHFLDTAEKLGLFKNTLIIWTTDHGYYLTEHDLHGKPVAELGALYEVTTHIPLLIYHPEGLGAGKRVNGIVQPPDILPSLLEFLEIPVPPHIEGKSFWPLLTREKKKIHDYAFSSRFPPIAGDAAALSTMAKDEIFDGLASSDRIVAPSTVTNDEWAFICAPKGRSSELYNLKQDPQQEKNVINQCPEVTEKMYKVWLEFLREHGASERRLRPFVEPTGEVHTPTEGKLYAFRNNLGRLMAYPKEQEARMYAYRDDAPGPRRQVEEMTFGALLDDNPKNLVRLYRQYFWAEDLA